MKTLPIVPLLSASLLAAMLTLAGCGNPYTARDDDDSADPDGDDDTSGDDDDDDSTAGDDDDSTAGDDDDSTAGDDDDATPGDDDDDDSTPPPSGTCSSWEPVDVVGSNKTFDMTLYMPEMLATFAGDFNGTETMLAQGADTFEGRSVWRVDSNLTGTIGGTPCDGSCGSGFYYFTCNPLGEVYMAGWQMTFVSGGTPTTVNAVYGGPGRKLMPAAEDMVVGTSWTSSHSETIDPGASGFLLELTFTMNFEITAEETITTPAGTFDTMVIESAYTVSDSGGLLYEVPIDGLDTMWVADGIGVVKVEHDREMTADTPMSPFQLRTLSSYGGLTPL